MRMERREFFRVLAALGASVSLPLPGCSDLSPGAPDLSIAVDVLGLRIFGMKGELLVTLTPQPVGGFYGQVHGAGFANEAEADVLIAGKADTLRFPISSRSAEGGALVLDTTALALGQQIVVSPLVM